MSFFSENQHLISALIKTTRDLSAPLDFSIKRIWRGVNDPPDADTVLENQLISTAKQFINLRHASSAEKQRYFNEVCHHFRLKGGADVFPLPDAQPFSTSIMQRLDRTPVIVSYLMEYDARHGTNQAAKARSLLFQFANLVIKSDGTVTPTEEAALQKFKETLYPFNPSALSEHEADKPRSSSENANNAAAIEQKIEPIEEEKPPRSLEELFAELNELVGLERVKSDVKQLVNFLKVQQMREERGMATLPVSRHLVFSGNPGTGKTTIARLMAQFYRTLTILSKGHLTETDRAGLVAGYGGQTALKVKEVVGRALGGVLFIDEAYALNPGGSGNDFGQEAVETLLKMMEDHRHDFIVVVAGYTEKMDDFLSSNPGLRSRFSKFIHFDDYTDKQLVEIFKTFCKKSDFKLSPAAEEELSKIFHILYQGRDEAFGNARLARNIFETSISKQANRIVSLANINEEILSTLEKEDIPNAEDLRALGVIGPTADRQLPP
ncbi:MAG: AAA family ATPase [Pyrinomonadaceae bacterium]|nr:AAA family ATPase [Pyrinomonadaceae bacterium]